MTANRLEVAPAFTALATTATLDYEDSITADAALNLVVDDLRAGLHTHTDEHLVAWQTDRAERLERVIAALAAARAAALREEWS